MRKYVSDYVKSVEEKLKGKIKQDDLEELELKITYFQHERFIHLLVTLFFALVTLVFLCLGMISIIFLIPFFLFIIFDVFYIVHYFFLENSVQYLYKIRDNMKVKLERMK